MHFAVEKRDPKTGTYSVQNPFLQSFGIACTVLFFPTLFGMSVILIGGILDDALRAGKSEHAVLYSTAALTVAGVFSLLVLAFTVGAGMWLQKKRTRSEWEETSFGIGAVQVIYYLGFTVELDIPDTAERSKNPSMVNTSTRR